MENEYETWEPQASEMNPEMDIPPSEDVIPDGTSPPVVESMADEELSLTEDSPNPNAVETEPAPKPKRATRRKRTATTAENDTSEAQGQNSMPPTTDLSLNREKAVAPADRDDSVLTIVARDEVETGQIKEDLIWHQIQTAFYTRRMLTGTIGGIEQMENGTTVAIADYKGFRVMIPLKEMMVDFNTGSTQRREREFLQRLSRVIGSMLGAEIDFIVKGIDNDSRSIVGSRKDAMLKKRQIYYLDSNDDGNTWIYPGRIVQARVLGVMEKLIWVEVFGVECAIVARNLSWGWIGDARDHYSIGDKILVRVHEVLGVTPEEIGIRIDVKSLTPDTTKENLKKCRVQSKYAGKVTDIHKGVVFVRLSNGVNAIAHTCLDYRMPGKKDDVTFVVTRLDEERGVAVGIIPRIIRQNL